MNWPICPLTRFHAEWFRARQKIECGEHAQWCQYGLEGIDGKMLPCYCGVIEMHGEPHVVAWNERRLDELGRWGCGRKNLNRATK